MNKIKDAKPPLSAGEARQTGSPIRKSRAHFSVSSKLSANLAWRHISHFAGSGWRWFSGTSDSVNKKGNDRTKRTEHTSSTSIPKNDSDDEEAAEFQSLLRSVRYDENRNLSYNEVSDEFRPAPIVQGRHFRKKQTRSLIVCGANEEVTPSQSAPVKKRWRRRFPINCYINPLFTSHSAPNSPARKQQQSSSLQRQRQEKSSLCAIDENNSGSTSKRPDVQNGNEDEARISIEARTRLTPLSHRWWYYTTYTYF